MTESPETALIARAERLRVGQIKEWGEILTGFETKNKYAIRDEHNQPLFFAAEDGGGFLAVLMRLFLKALRPFSMQVMDQHGGVLLSLRRPFRFFFHRLEIFDRDGAMLGAVQKKWSFLRRIYAIEDEHGREVLALFGPILRPWTFQVLKHDHEVGLIQKKWSGIGKEIFTDADNFGVKFSPTLELEERLLLLAAVFLIDFVHFENTQ